jgi:predicted TIM-barrel fold metal-dependent hydrolase
LHFHTVGGYIPDHVRKMVLVGSDPTRATADMTPADVRTARSAFAANITQFQINMANVLTSMVFSGALERYPRLKVVLGESGIGWIPYVLNRMDAEWEDQFKDWISDGRATTGATSAGRRIRPIDQREADRRSRRRPIMWGSDFPHPDGIWPDSRE